MDTLSVSMIIIAVPVLLVYLLKANAGLLFFAACAGLVLLSTLDNAVVATAGSIVPGEGEAYVRLAVVIASIAFAAVVFSNKVHGAKLVFHAVIALLIGVMLWLLLPAVTGVSWLVSGVNSQLWLDANQFSTLIIAAAFGLSSLAVIPARHREKGKHKSKH